MGRHRLAAATTGIAALLSAMLTMAALHASPSHRLAHDEPIVLSGEVTSEVRRLATVVVRTAHEHGVEIVPAELEIRFVDRVVADGFVGGRTNGRLILVGRNVARPERTLLHELTHAVVGVEFGHGEPWRSVYIAAVRDAFGDRAAERELRRIRWVYDKSYLDIAPSASRSVAHRTARTRGRGWVGLVIRSRPGPFPARGAAGSRCR